MPSTTRRSRRALALGLLPLFAAVAAQAQTTWNGTLGNTAESWNTNANWTGGGGVFPNAASTNVSLTGNFSAAKTVNLNQAVTVGNLTIGDTTATLVAITLAHNTGNLTFDNGGAGSTITSIGAGNVITANTTLANSLTVTVNGTSLSYSGAISGGFGLSKNGTGTLSLSGNNTFTGGVTVTQGLLSTNHASAFGTGGITLGGGSDNVILSHSANGITTAGTITISSSGSGNVTIQNGNTSGSSGVYSGAVVFGKATDILAQPLTGTNTSATFTFTGAFSGNGLMTIKAPSDANQVRFSNSNNHTGGILIASGTLSLTGGSTHGGGGITVGDGVGVDTLLSNTNRIGDTNAVTVSSSGVYSIGSGNDTIGALTLKSGGQITGTTGIITASSYSLEGGTITAILAGNSSIALTKSTSGTATLSGINTLAGPVSISAGVLALSGTGSLNAVSGVSVASGATFSNGSSTTFNKALTLTEGSTLAAGAFAPSAITIVADLTSGTYSTISGNSTASFAKPSALTLTLSNIVAGDYTLFSDFTSISGTFTSVVIDSLTLNAGNSFTGTSGGFVFTFTDATNLLSIAIPEPSSFAALAGLGALGLVAARRRRR
jgi:fibronectin-binding autotransporter adhesin